MWSPIPDVTAALSLASADDIALPVRRSRAERQAIVLDTAERLFSGRSSRSVGMDELVRETGLGKMTVYRLFKSKDDLVGAYLARKAATVLAFIDAELVRLEGDPRAALLSVVDAVEHDVTRTGFRGCPFTNVSSEYDDPQHPARSAAADYKFELHMRLERLADEIVPGGGEDLAAQIHLIIDGMYLSGGLLGPDGPTVEVLGTLSEALETVDQARGLLYGFHQLTGKADLLLQDAVALLRKAGHGPLGDDLGRELVGRNVIADRWTFQIVEDYDDNYWSVFRDFDGRARAELTDGDRHVYEPRMKQRE